MPTDMDNAYIYDSECDLTKAKFWLFNPGSTPPGNPMTPMFESIYLSATNWGFFYASNKLGIPTSKGIAVRSYNGYEFITVIIPDLREKEERAKEFGDRVDFLVKNFDDMWEESKKKLLSYLEKVKGYDFQSASWVDLVQVFNERIDAEKKMYEIHHYLGQGIAVVYGSFQEVCTEMLGIQESTPLFDRLFLGFDNDLNKADRGLIELAIKAKEWGLKQILLRSDPKIVLDTLLDSDMGKKWKTELEKYLDVHGWRCSPPLGFTSPSWKEDPSLAIQHVRQYLQEGISGPDKSDEKIQLERTEAERLVMEKVPEEHKEWFERLMKTAQKYSVWNLEHTYYCEMLQHSLTRYVLLHIGKRLSDVGCIEEPEDIMFLVPGECIKALTRPEITYLEPIVRKRRKKWEENVNFTPPPMVSTIGFDQVSEIIVDSRDPLAVRISTGFVNIPRSEKRADFVGKAVSPGIAEGLARIVHSAQEIGMVRKSEILVAPYVDAAWSPVFSIVDGIVTETGGVLSDGAALARQHGIPHVTNVLEATQKIKTGQRIRVDGNLGTVRVLDFLDGKKILVVDDEQDVLDVLEELLSMCKVSKATSFDEAKKLLEKGDFDVAVLDIMGVDGYRLLSIAKEKGVTPVMLTAHAFSIQDTAKSFKEGAAYYIPKDKIGEITTFLNDVLEAKEKGRSFWGRWFERFAPYYEKRFGPGWQRRHKEFWDIFQQHKSLFY